jgi:hypothetical protein
MNGVPLGLTGHSGVERGDGLNRRAVSQRLEARHS